ncbi:MAG: hypothetical protein HC875_19145 [Anaerolineales bacterium]|nr:hypothetical protein [Anaerolineales bacterium]
MDEQIKIRNDWLRELENRILSGEIQNETRYEKMVDETFALYRAKEIFEKMLKQTPNKTLWCG